jgi:hypothetical protein
MNGPLDSKVGKPGANAVKSSGATNRIGAKSILSSTTTSFCRFIADFRTFELDIRAPYGKLARSTRCPSILAPDRRAGFGIPDFYSFFTYFFFLKIFYYLSKYLYMHRHVEKHNLKKAYPIFIQELELDLNVGAKFLEFLPVEKIIKSVYFLRGSVRPCLLAVTWYRYLYLES